MPLLRPFLPGPCVIHLTLHIYPFLPTNSFTLSSQTSGTNLEKTSRDSIRNGHEVNPSDTQLIWSDLNEVAVAALQVVAIGLYIEPVP